MKTVRTIIKEQMRAKGWGPYDLAKAVRGEMVPQTIYNFVKGKTEINSRSLALLMEALDLEIRPKRAK